MVFREVERTPFRGLGLPNTHRRLQEVGQGQS